MSNEILIKIFLDILDSIQIVIKRSSVIKSYNDFIKNENGIEKLDAISMRLQAIGEAIKKVASTEISILNRYPEINWKDIINFRDKISHHYFDLDAEVIFLICENDIPLLEKTIKNILNDLEKS